MRQVSTEILKHLWMPIAAFFAPIQGVIIAIILTILLDTILGITKSVKKSGWKSFSSRKLSSIASKSLLYLVVIYLFFPIDYFILDSIIKNIFIIDVNYLTTKLISLSIILIEIKSIDENLREMNINIMKNFKELFRRAKETKKEWEE
jgi:ABC-type sugar transport system permease subunit